MHVDVVVTFYKKYKQFNPHFCNCPKPGAIFTMTYVMVYVVTVPSQELYLQWHMSWSMLWLSQAMSYIYNDICHGLFCDCPKPWAIFTMTYMSWSILWLSQAMSYIYNDICHGLCCVQWVEVKGDCLFYWSWWNCCPSLFKLSFHNLQFNMTLLITSRLQLPIYFIIFRSYNWGMVWNSHLFLITIQFMFWYIILTFLHPT
jgi:hypothetical protein